MSLEVGQTVLANISVHLFAYAHKTWHVLAIYIHLGMHMNLYFRNHIHILCNHVHILQIKYRIFPHLCPHNSLLFYALSNTGSNLAHTLYPITYIYIYIYMYICVCIYQDVLKKNTYLYTYIYAQVCSNHDYNHIFEYMYSFKSIVGVPSCR